MTFPYLCLTPDLYEHLGDILEQCGVGVLTAEAPRRLPVELAAPEAIEDSTAKIFLISDGNARVKISAHFDTTFGYYVAYISCPSNRRKEGKLLEALVGQHLQRHGASWK